MFTKIIIANRGEIAVRIIHACREMGITSVAVYSEVDAHARHVQLADEAVLIGPAAPSESYLNGEALIEVAQQRGCQAIHPGYGFLSENADFAAAVESAGLIFIGPPAKAIRLMGSKTAARSVMQAAGVPVVPGYQADEADDQQLLTAAEMVGYPLLVKAAAGGGGKGMRRVEGAEDLPEALQSARREARNAFGDDTVYLEKYLDQPHHIEIQIFGDQQGHILHLFERECSIQRRHQKIIEETPSPLLDEALRQQMGQTAVAAAQAVNYINAGTVEFLVDAERNFYFLEMNTRLQVEHPITELVTGLDLVKWQIRVAAGEPLSFEQQHLTQRGHAIECRIYAEDPANDFLPETGTLLRVVEPAGPGIRVDSGVATGDTVTHHYDPLLAKLVVLGADREEARQKMIAALKQYVILGLITNLAFLGEVLAHDRFRQGQTTTDFVAQFLQDRPTQVEDNIDLALIAAAISEALSANQGRVAWADSDVDGNTPWETLSGFRLGGSQSA